MYSYYFYIQEYVYTCLPYIHTYVHTYLLHTYINTYIFKTYAYLKTNIYVLYICIFYNTFVRVVVFKLAQSHCTQNYPFFLLQELQVLAPQQAGP